MFKRGRFEIVETFAIVDTIPLQPPTPFSSTTCSIPIRKGRFEIKESELSELSEEQSYKKVQKPKINIQQSSGSNVSKPSRKGRFEIYTIHSDTYSSNTYSSNTYPDILLSTSPKNMPSILYGRFEITILKD
jgi:hypothetical protein